MMKSVKRLLTGCMLSGTVILLSSGFLIAQKNQVQVKETLFLGDSSLVDGLNLTAGIYSPFGHQYWEYAIPLSDSSKTEVSHAVWWQSTTSEEYEFAYLNLNVIQNDGVTFNNEGEIETYGNEISLLSMLPVNELIDLTQFENDQEFTFLLSDYISEYPLEVDGSSYMGKEIKFSDASRKLLAQEIKIPVIPEQELMLSAHDDFPNQPSYLVLSPSNIVITNYPSIEILEDELFFFHQSTSQEVVHHYVHQPEEKFDCMESPAYFYQMNYHLTEENKEETLEISNIQLLGSLPFGQKANNLKIFGDNLVILVETFPDTTIMDSNNSSSFLAIYDKTDFTLKQEIPLSGYYTNILDIDGHIFLFSNNVQERNHFTFLKQGEDGDYEIILNHVNDYVIPEEMEHVLIHYDDNIHYIEDKLIMTQLVYAKNPYEVMCEKLLLRVYDETGILYGSLYEFEQLEKISPLYCMYFISENRNIS